MSKLRSAAQDSPFAKDINFAAYTVPRTSGSYEGGMLQRMLAQVGGGACHCLEAPLLQLSDVCCVWSSLGAKALRFFIFGPEVRRLHPHAIVCSCNCRSHTYR